jgi:hypothetical protein
MSPDCKFLLIQRIDNQQNRPIVTCWRSGIRFFSLPARYIVKINFFIVGFRFFMDLYILAAYTKKKH